jgi:U3 small nucleolar RNA-associated protein 25
MYSDKAAVEEDVPEESSSDDEVPPSNSYNSLLATFQRSAPAEEPRRKKRKLDGSPARKDIHIEDDTAQHYEPEGTDVGDDLDQANGEEEQGSDVDNENDADVANDEGVIDGDFVDDDEDSADPFETHFDHPDEKDLKSRLQKLKAHALSSSLIKSDIIGKFSFAKPADVDIELPRISSPKDIKLKKRLAEPTLKVMSSFTPLQKDLAAGIANYSDLLFGGRTPENASQLRDLACLHAMNHLYKTRDRILKNTSRLARDESADLELRDQGFTRPKVLILLETRAMCVKYMDVITKLCAPEQQENRKRFQDTFIRADPEGFGKDKPADFNELFEGNDDNEFRLGIKFTRKTIKYYSQFYNSDIIFASPLGLRRAMKDHE